MSYERVNAGVDFVDNERFLLDDANQVADDIDHLAIAALQTNVFAGGSELVGIDASASGDVRLLDWLPLYFDNTSNRWTGTSATFIARYRYRIRVSNVAVSFTPKLWYAASEALLQSAPVAATISGEAACAATDADYLGTDQLQTVSFTIPSGAKYWAAGGVIGGTPGAGYQVWARAVRDIFIHSSP